ncbi:glycosyltransferase family 4 protein [Methylocaldum sp. MU1018]
MRIAQVAPLYESVPPKLYGGTERIVHYLTEELVGAGHEVTLFASADSETSATLEPIVSKALRLDRNVIDPLLPHLLMMDQVRKTADEFDVIHFHTGCLHFPVFRECSTPHVTTLHGRLDIRELSHLLKAFPDTPLVSISDYQRKPVAWANWTATVYHGLPEELYTFRAEPGAYLAFLGRISPEKRVDRAIEIAICAGMPLKIAAKVDKADREYFEQIKSLLDHPLVEFVGEVDEREKNELLGHAYALLFPIDWPEPFGLVMIEAMACGTPVIAFRNGSVPEVMRNARTGFIVEDVRQAVAAVERVGELNRADCRREFEYRFSARRMASDYIRIYRQLCQKHKQKTSSALKVFGSEVLEEDGKRLPMLSKQTF